MPSVDWSKVLKAESVPTESAQAVVVHNCADAGAENRLAPSTPSPMTAPRGSAENKQ